MLLLLLIQINWSDSTTWGGGLLNYWEVELNKRWWWPVTHCKMRHKMRYPQDTATVQKISISLVSISRFRPPLCGLLLLTNYLCMKKSDSYLILHLTSLFVMNAASKAKCKPSKIKIWWFLVFLQEQMKSQVMTSIITNHRLKSPQQRSCETKTGHFLLLKQSSLTRVVRLGWIMLLHRYTDLDTLGWGCQRNL